MIASRLVVAAIYGFCALAAAASERTPDGFSAPEIPVSRSFELPSAESLVFRGAIFVSAEYEAFGGLSGLVREPDGGFVAVSDRARWIRFGLVRVDGELMGVDALAAAPFRNAGGATVSGRGWDAEGLTRGPDGRLWVSFEGDHRLGAFAAPGAPAGEERRAPSWERFKKNTGLEALATDAEGRLWAIREGADEAGGSPVFVLGPDGVEEKTLPRDGAFAPTGADFGPDGRLYVAERAFSFLGGFRFRLRRVSWSEGREPETDETLLELPSSSMIDNIEALAIWREGEGTWLLLASDDNFFPLQRNVLALYEVVD